MLKLLKRLSELRSAVLVALILPIPFVIWNFGSFFNELPDFPYSKFTITFEVPGMMSKEIENKVIIPAEKMFNGLQGLLLQESKVKHEQGRIFLEFHNDQNPERSLLFIQEKLDRLKVSLPSNVEEILVKLRKREVRADLEVSLPKGLYAYEWNSVLETLGAMVTRSKPYINDYQVITIKIDVVKLRMAQLALGSVGKSLKVAGLTYRLGKQSGVSYLLEGTYTSKSDLENILVGNRGDRPIRLGDIADVSLKLLPSPRNVKLWIDNNLFEKSKIKDIIENKIVGASVVNPLPKALKAFVLPDLIIAIGLLLIQMAIFYLTFRNLNAVLIVFIFSLLWSVEFIFMSWMMNGEVTQFDFATLYLANTISCFFLHFLLCRIRSYFLPSHLEKFIQRDLQQAIIFCLVEYLPTFIFLYFLFTTLSLPVLLGNISVVSSEILKSLIIYTPLSIFLIVIMVLFSPLNWITQQKNVKTELFKKSLIRKGRVWFIYPIVMMALLTPFIWDHLTLGVSGKGALNDWRGNERQLTYYEALDSPKGPLKTIESTEYGPVMNWNLTPTGLRALAKRDVNSFQRTLQDMMKSRQVLMYEGRKNYISVNYDQSIANTREFGELNIGGKGQVSMPLRIFTIPKISLMEKSIFRGQLNRQKKVVIPDDVSKGNLFHKLNNPATFGSSKTRFMFNEYEKYLNNHWTVVLFLFVLLSLFLNSFYRGALLSLFSMSVWKLHDLIGVLWGSSFNLDSLWMAAIPIWLCLTIILLLSKVADIERLRGNSQKLVLLDLGSKMSLAMVYGITLFIASLTWWWIACNIITANDLFSFSSELLRISVGLIIVGAFTFFILFRLYYVTSESTLESIRLKLYLWYYRRKSK
jgi:hypothetical protein